MPQVEQKFGFNQIGNETPKWATWFFRIFFYVTSLAALSVNIFTDMDDSTKNEINKWVTFANLAAHGFSKMWGFDTSEYNKP